MLMFPFFSLMTMVRSESLFNCISLLDASKCHFPLRSGLESSWPAREMQNTAETTTAEKQENNLGMASLLSFYNPKWGGLADKDHMCPETLVSELPVSSAPWAMENLPPFPAVATRLLHVLSHEDVNINEIAK